jgi:hypothetical protein
MPAEPPTDSLLPTRQSLLTRLRDWQNRDGWGELFDSCLQVIPCRFPLLVERGLTKLSMTYAPLPGILEIFRCVQRIKQ